MSEMEWFEPHYASIDVHSAHGFDTHREEDVEVAGLCFKARIERRMKNRM